MEGWQNPLASIVAECNEYKTNREKLFLSWKCMLNGKMKWIAISFLKQS